MKTILLLLLIVLSFNLSAQNLLARHFTKNLDSLAQIEDYSPIQSFHGIINPLPILDTINQLTEKDKLLKTKYDSHSIDETINELVKDDINLVFLSEHHLIPRSRKTLYDIIKLLHAKGFTRIYVEAMDFVDKELDERGYPIAKTGYYICEPTFAEIIRFSLNNEIELLPYDELDFQIEPSRRKVKSILQEEIKIKSIKNEYVNSSQTFYDDFSLPLSSRDYNQYKNIIQTYDPTIKSIILCGHGHGIKRRYAGWRSLGYWISKHPEINLVSIENSEPLYQSDKTLNNLMQIYNAKEPFALWNKKEKRYFCEKSYDPIYEKKVDHLWDATILYPINATLNEEWKNYKNKKQVDISISKYNIRTPFVIYTFLKSELESEHPIPTSSQFFYEKQSSIKIYCHPEKENIIIWDGLNKIIID